MVKLSLFFASISYSIVLPVTCCTACIVLPALQDDAVPKLLARFKVNTNDTLAVFKAVSGAMVLVPLRHTAGMALAVLVHARQLQLWQLCNYMQRPCRHHSTVDRIFQVDNPLYSYNHAILCMSQVSKEDFEDVVGLLPENTPLPASDKMTYLLARLEVGHWAQCWSLGAP